MEYIWVDEIGEYVLLKTRVRRPSGEWPRKSRYKGFDRSWKAFRSHQFKPVEVHSAYVTRPF